MREFRNHNPFHAQVIGLTDPNVYGERVLIVSEPSPLLPRTRYREALASLFGPALKDAELKRNPIGYDGWTEDVVATLRYAATPEADRGLANDLTRLAQRLFGTAYKFAPLKLAEPIEVRTHEPLNSRKDVQMPGQSLVRTEEPVLKRLGEGKPLLLDPKVWKPVQPALAPPNLGVTAAELNEWLLAPGRMLQSLDTGADSALLDLLRDGQPGVYFSRERGLVVLLLPRDQKLNAYRADLRKYALDTDAIVGAVAVGEKRLAIVGRERDTPLAAVPPLRAETILLLAATGEAELGQSYERRTVFAGKLKAGEEKGRDWAPIFLSKNLYNTEFGSLLNITDQLLKSWSDAGRAKYVRFPYPAPSTYPFPAPVSEVLNVNRVTYNWNTIGVGSVSGFEGVQIFALNRTGSLPVSYCPEETCVGEKSSQIVEVEEKAYKWFSDLRDSNLQRAVQYTALYQIFRTFHVLAEPDEDPPTNIRVATDTLTASTERAIAAIENGEATTWLESLQYATEARAQIGELLEQRLSLSKIRVGRSAFLKKVDDIFVKSTNEHKSNVFQSAEALGRLRVDCGSQSIKIVSALLADRHNSRPWGTRQCQTAQWQARDAVSQALSFLRGEDSVRLNFVRAAGAIESGYIKTPSTVLSWQLNPGSAGINLQVTGGHNLYSRTTRLETSVAVPRGEIQIERSGDTAVLKINPNDAPHSNALARAHARNAGKSEAEIKAILETELATTRAVRPVREGLGLVDVAPAEGRGLTASRSGESAFGEVGLFPDPQIAVARFEKLALERDLDVVLARYGDGFLVIRFRPPPPVPLRAATEPAMLEALGKFSGQTARMRLPSGQSPVKIGFTDKFSEGELRGIMETEDLRTAAGGGGGWSPPRPPRNFEGMPPEPDKPGGFFYRAEESGGGAGGGDGYHGYDRYGDSINLKLFPKERARVHEVMIKPVDWARAEIRRIEPVPVSGPLKSMEQIGFEITVPVRDLPVLERYHLAPRKALLTRVVAFFKRATTPADAIKTQAVTASVVEQSAKEGLVPLDALARLKSQMLREVKPDALHFYNTYGKDDLMIVRHDTTRSADERDRS